MNGQMDESGEEVASWFMGAVDRRGKFNRREKYDQTGKSGNESRSRLDNSGNLLKLEKCV